MLNTIRNRYNDNFSVNNNIKVRRADGSRSDGISKGEFPGSNPIGKSDISSNNLPENILASILIHLFFLTMARLLNHHL